MSDAELVRQLKQGDHSAYEQLVEKYGRRLYSVSLRILRHSEDAEDAVQESFLKVLHSIQSFREESSLYTWLYRIVSNKALEKLRQRGRQQVVPIDSLLPHFEHGQHVEAIADWRLPDQPLDSQELSDFFEQCIDELPEEYRLAYILKDVERFSEDHVCRVLRLTKSAMKNRVHRARLIIRGRIEERFFQSQR